MLHGRADWTKDGAIAFNWGMQVSRNTARPLSPHLTIWKWGPAMLVSILHRATGTALALGGGIIFIWWLVAAASGPAAYATFYGYVAVPAEGDALAGITTILAKIVGIGLTWSFFQHMASGVRHFVLDTGAGYELKTNRMGSLATIGFALVMTVLVWSYLLVK